MKKKTSDSEMSAFAYKQSLEVLFHFPSKQIHLKRKTAKLTSRHEKSGCPCLAGMTSAMFCEHAYVG